MKKKGILMGIIVMNIFLLRKSLHRTVRMRNAYEKEKGRTDNYGFDERKEIT